MKSSEMVSVKKEKIARLTAAANHASRENARLKQRLQEERSDKIKQCNTLQEIVSDLYKNKSETLKIIVERLENVVHRMEQQGGKELIEESEKDKLTIVTEAATSPAFAEDAIARLHQAQNDLLARSRGNASCSPPSPTALVERKPQEAVAQEQLQLQLDRARESIETLEERNAALQKDLQLALLSLSKSSQSRKLAAAFAARSTKIKLEATLSAIKASQHSVSPRSPLSVNASSIPATPSTSYSCSTPLEGFLTPYSDDVDEQMRKLTVRLDHLQRELNAAVETRFEDEQTIRDLNAKLVSAGSDIFKYQSRIQELERSNMEYAHAQSLVGTRLPDSQEREAMAMRRDLALEDLALKSARRIAVLENSLREEQESSRSLSSKLRSAVQDVCDSKNFQQMEQSLRELNLLLGLPAPSAAGPWRSASLHNKENNDEEKPSIPLGSTKKNTRMLASPTVLKPASPMERVARISPAFVTATPMR